MRRHRVVFDARMWKHAGIGRYISELSTALIAQDRGFDLTFLAEENFEKDILSRTASGARVTFLKAVSRIYGPAEQMEIALKARGSDLLHVPHFNIPAFFPGKLVTTVHDLIYLRDPNSLRSKLGRTYTRFLFECVAKKSSAIITVSQNTKTDFQKKFPRVPEGKLRVIAEAASAHFQRVEDAATLDRVRRKFGLEKPYVLFIGSLKPHKNLDTLIQALFHLRQKHTLTHELVVVGRSDPKHPEISGARGRHPFVKYVGEAEDADLASLYTLAEVFVLPSFYEGFGLPVLEAMACGTPVIVSRRASLPEVAGDAGILFDPDRVDALSDALYTILKNRDLRQELSKKGLERSGNFSWKKAAEETALVYQRVLEG